MEHFSPAPRSRRRQGTDRRNRRRRHRDRLPSRSCSTRACARRWPRTAATSSSTASSTASSSCTCTAPAPAARVRRQLCVTASRTCSSTTSRTCRRSAPSGGQAYRRSIAAGRQDLGTARMDRIFRLARTTGTSPTWCWPRSMNSQPAHQRQLQPDAGAVPEVERGQGTAAAGAVGRQCEADHGGAGHRRHRL